MPPNDQPSLNFSNLGTGVSDIFAGFGELTQAAGAQRPRRRTMNCAKADGSMLL
jgi:hypothetical protein